MAGPRRPCLSRNGLTVVVIACIIALLAGCSRPPAGSDLEVEKSERRGNERAAPRTPDDGLYAILISDEHDAAGLIRRGDHVDITAADERRNPPEVVLVARDVEIVETPTDSGNRRRYVIKATDEEWRAIKSAMRHAGDGGLMLSLRPST